MAACWPLTVQGRVVLFLAAGLSTAETWQESGYLANLRAELLEGPVAKARMAISLSVDPQTLADADFVLERWEEIRSR